MRNVDTEQAMRAVRRAILGAGVLSVLSCGDATAPGAGSVVFCPSGGADSFATLTDAVAAVESGGTILVCDGLHDLDDQLVDKSVTIRSQNPGGATIGDADPAQQLQQGRPAIRIDGVGAVRFVDLTFHVRGRGVVLAGRSPTAASGDGPGTFAVVTFDSTRWLGRNNTSSIGIMIRNSTAPIPRVEIVRSSMSDMNIGIFAIGKVEVNTTFSSFARMATAGPDYSFDGQSSSFGRIEDNTFTECGPVGCIRMPTGGAVTIARNHMHGTPGISSLAAIVLVRLGGAGQSDVITVRDNTIVGAVIGNGALQTEWTFQSGVLLVDADFTEHVISGNHISNSYAGIDARGDVYAHNNFISGGRYAIAQTDHFNVRFLRNDVTGTTGSFPAALGLADYRCNWWGQASGPIDPPAGMDYTPFAIAPIAGKTTACP